MLEMSFYLSAFFILLTFFFVNFHLHFLYFIFTSVINSVPFFIHLT